MITLQPVQIKVYGEANLHIPFNLYNDQNILVIILSINSSSLYCIALPQEKSVAKLYKRLFSKNE